MEKSREDNIVFEKKTSLISGCYHIHDFYELYLLLEGDLNFFIHQSCYHIKGGSLLMINDQEVHRNTNLTNYPHTRIYIHVPQSFFRDYKTSDLDLSSCFTDRIMGEKNLLQLTPEQVSYYLNVYERMENARNSGMPGGELLIDTYVIQLLIMINNLSQRNQNQHYQTEFPKYPREYPKDINRVIHYLEEHLLETITLDHIAEYLSQSKYHICHMFKKETGTTILQYLLLQRISRAKGLLAQGLNVTETCYQAGFNDYANFITSFKKVTGYTPKAYQKLYQ